MKKIIIIFILTFANHYFTWAQENKFISGKIIAGTTSIAIPTEVKSELTYKANSTEFIKYERFSEKMNGTIYIIADSKDKIVAVILPESANKFTPVKCFKSSFWGSGSGWSGFWDCILN